MKQKFKHLKSFEDFDSSSSKSYIKMYESYIVDKDINLILDAYLECALWTEEERAKEEDDLNFEAEYGEIDDEYEKGDGSLRDLVPSVDVNIHNIDPDSKIDAYLDIKKFLNIVGDAVEDIDETSIGHDLWLSRNGHGAGFFDHMYDSDVEDKLMNAARSLGSKDIFIQDGKIFFS